MPTQGTATWLLYVAWNTSTNAYVTGDAANQTIRLMKDGAESAPTNSPFEIDSTNRPGLYAVAATSVETLFNLVNIGGKSSTANVVLIDRTYSFTPTSTAQIGVNVINIRDVLAASSLAQANVNVVSFNGATTATSLAAGNVNVVSLKGTASVGAAGYVGVDWASITNPNSAQVLSATTISGVINAVPATLVGVTSTAQFGVNVVTWAGDPVTFPTVTGFPPVDAQKIAGVAAATSLAASNVNVVSFNKASTATSLATGGVNVNQWLGGAIPAPNVTGEPLVDVNHWRGVQPLALNNQLVQGDVEKWGNVTVNALISGRVDVNVGQMQSSSIYTGAFVAGTMTTTVFAANFLTSALVDATQNNAAADALLDRSNAIETGITPRLAWRYGGAADAGVVSGAGTTTVWLQAIGNAATNRIQATTDFSGNRISVTLG